MDLESCIYHQVLSIGLSVQFGHGDTKIRMATRVSHSKGRNGPQVAWLPVSFRRRMFREEFGHQLNAVPKMQRSPFEQSDNHKTCAMCQVHPQNDRIPPRLNISNSCWPSIFAVSKCKALAIFHGTLSLLGRLITLISVWMMMTPRLMSQCIDAQVNLVIFAGICQIYKDYVLTYH